MEIGVFEENSIDVPYGHDVCPECQEVVPEKEIRIIIFHPSLGPMCKRCANENYEGVTLHPILGYHDKNENRARVRFRKESHRIKVQKLQSYDIYC
jgi:hypothetical protein